MDTTTLTPLLSSLSTSIDDLEDALEPLLQTPLSQTASKLPLLDKAKLHVLTTYAIESLLFSYLSLNGVNAKTHPIFTEIMRVKQYNEKIKLAEAAPGAANRTQMLDRSAAQRFIRAGLAGNERFDQERAERQGREKEAAKEKLEALEKAKVQLQAEMASRKRKAEEIEVPEESEEVVEEMEEVSEDGELEPEAEEMEQEDTSSVLEKGQPASTSAKKKKPRRKNDPEKKRLKAEKKAEKKAEINAAKRQRKKAKKEAKKQSG